MDSEYHHFILSVKYDIKRHNIYNNNRKKESEQVMRFNEPFCVFVMCVIVTEQRAKLCQFFDSMRELLLLDWPTVCTL